MFYFFLIKKDFESKGGRKRKEKEERQKKEKSMK